MITVIIGFVGGMLGTLFINYVLHSPNKKWDEIEEQQYRNSGHYGSKK